MIVSQTDSLLFCQFDVVEVQGSLGEGDGVGEAGGEFVAVGDTEQSGFIFCCDLQQQRADFFCGPGVQIAGGLIGQQQGRLMNQSPTDCDSLTFAAGESSRSLVHAMRQTNTVNQFLGPRPDVTCRREAGQCRQQHVFQDTALWQQLMILKDEADMLIAKRGEPSGTQSPRVFAKNFDQPRGWLVQSSGKVQQRTLATSRGPSYRHRTARQDSQADIVEDGNGPGRSFKRAGHAVHVQNEGHGRTPQSR